MGFEHAISDLPVQGRFSLQIIGHQYVQYVMEEPDDDPPTHTQHPHPIKLPGNQDIKPILSQCWVNAGPQSATLAQHYPNLGPCLVFVG